MLRRVAGGLGRLLIAGGVLLLLFVAYQLWGTGLKEASSQHALKRQFDKALAHSDNPTVSNGTNGSSPSPTDSSSSAGGSQNQAAPPPPPAGHAVGILKIPAIDLEKVVVEGVGESDLREGPGHYPQTPLPGQPGNAAIAGHRTTYGAPFYRLNELVAGNSILITTTQGAFRYVVQRQMVVNPGDVAVVGPTPGNHLTLTTCTPRYSAAQRLVVVAALAGLAAPPSQASSPTTTQPGQQTTTTVANSLDGPGGNWLPSVGWGLGFAAAFGAAWWLSRRFAKTRRLRRVLTWLACAPALGVLLFFFFSSVSVLLPAQY